MNDLRNIECFAMAARGILRALLEEFPRPVEIDSLALQRQLVAAGELAPDCAWETGAGSLVDSSISYLVTEGVMRSIERASITATDPATGILRPIFIWKDCALTSAGFAALNRELPEKQPLSKGKSFGAWIVTTGAAVKGAISAVDGISQLLAAVKHLG